MSDTSRDAFIVGLRNAQVMEVQASELLNANPNDLSYPDVKAKVSSHFRETNEQRQGLEQCLEAQPQRRRNIYCREPTGDGSAKAGDEILKSTFADNAFENYRTTESPLGLLSSARQPM